MAGRAGTLLCCLFPPAILPRSVRREQGWEGEACKGEKKRQTKDAGGQREGGRPSLLFNCLGSRVTGIDVAQTLLAVSHIDVSQLMLDAQEAAGVSTWLSQGHLTAHRPVALDRCPTADLRPQALALVSDFCLLTDHCLQNLTSVSGTGGLWTQDSRHNLSCSLEFLKKWPVWPKLLNDLPTNKFLCLMIVLVIHHFMNHLYYSSLWTKTLRSQIIKRNRIPLLMFDNLLLSNKSIPNLQSKKTFFAILASPTLSKDILTCMDLIFPP